MRAVLTLLVLLVPITAAAESRIGIHAGGGLEALMLRSAPPAGVVEAGLTAELLWPGKQWGLGAGFERIGRSEDGLADEWKLDAGIGFTDATRRYHALVGVGVRTLTLPGDARRQPATIRGVDLIRLDNRLEIVRRGAVSLDFYLGWTVGLYQGRQSERVGDMAPASRPFLAVTSVCILGLQTSFTLE